MARHWRDDEDVRPFVMPFAVEMLQLPERFSEQDLLMNRDILALHVDRIDPELGLSPGRGCVGENLEAGRDERPHRAITQRIGRVVEPSGAQTCKLARTCEKRTLHFIGVVEHRTSSSASHGQQMWRAFAPVASLCCGAKILP